MPAWLNRKLCGVQNAHRLHWFRANYPVVAKAYQFAQKAHEGQVRKFGNKPFFTHPERVAWRVACQISQTVHPNEGAQPYEVLVAAALLHDVLEDTDCSKDTLAQEFPEPVVSLVVQLTNVKVPGLTREQQKASDHLRLQSVSKDAKLIKLIDRIDNLLELEGASESFLAKYHAETKHLLESVFQEYAEEQDCQTSQIGELVHTVYSVMSGDRDFVSEGDGPSSDPLN